MAPKAGMEEELQFEKEKQKQEAGLFFRLTNKVKSGEHN